MKQLQRLVSGIAATGMMIGGSLTAAGLSGCAGAGGGAMENGVPSGQGASFGPGYPAGSAAWKEKERVAYRTAFMAGMQDQKEGFRFDDDRGAAALDVAVRGFYRLGYRRGYYHEINIRRAARLAPEEEAGPGPGTAADSTAGASGSASAAVAGEKQD